MDGRPIMTRLHAKARQDGECLVWTGARTRAGYGVIRVDGKVQRVHRLAWIAENGDPPEETPMILHHCDNPPCFRIDHLYAGAAADNAGDRSAAQGLRSVETPHGRAFYTLTPSTEPPTHIGLHVDPEFMACEVDRRARIWLTDNGWLRWELDDARRPQPLPAEWVFRGLQDADLDDPAWLLAVLDRRGMLWQPFSAMVDRNADVAAYEPTGLPPRDHPFSTMHISDVRSYLLLLRAMAAECLRGDFTGVLFDGLQLGMQPFGLMREVENAIAGRPPYTPALVDLYEAGCAQVFMAVNENAPAKRCANETCGRVFFRKIAETRYGQHRRTGVKYCSDSCQAAAQQRAYRHRRASRRQWPVA